MLQEELGSIFAGAIGLSFRMIIQSKGNIIIRWTGRSTMQFHVTEVSYIAAQALRFCLQQILPNGTFEGRICTSLFVIERSIQEDIFLSIRTAATKIIKYELNRQAPMIIVTPNFDIDYAIK